MAGVDSDAKTIIKVGPFGSCYAPNWDAKGLSEITVIFISFGEDLTSSRINSLQFQYLENGKEKLSPVYGKHVGSNFETVVLSNAKTHMVANVEYITALSGATFGVGTNERVTCLTIETNQKKYGPFGSIPAGAKSFSFRFGPDRLFDGFFGYYYSFCGFLASIGVYIRPNLN